MNMLSFPMNAIRDLSNLSIYNTDYATMVHNYIGSAIYIASPGLYAILTTLFFGVVSGILGTLPVAISFALTVKYRTLLILPTFVLLNATTYLNILDRNKSSLSWYKYLLLLMIPLKYYRSTDGGRNYNNNNIRFLPLWKE